MASRSSRRTWLLLSVLLVSIGPSSRTIGAAEKLIGPRPKLRVAGPWESDLPAHALMRLGTNRFRPGEHVEIVAVSQDGKRIASRSRNILCMWEAATGREVWRIRVEESRMDYFGFSPDGKYLALPLKETGLGMIDASSSKVLKENWRDAGNCTLSAFSPDGTLLAATMEAKGSDGEWKYQVLLWDLKADKERSRFGGGKRQIHALAFSPDSKWLLSSGDDMVLDLWEVRTAKRTRQFARGKEGFWSVAFSPDGRTVAASELESAVNTWDFETGKLIRRWKPTSGVTRVDWLKGKNQLLTASRDGVLRVWDAETGRESRSFGGHPGGIHSFSLTADRSVVVAAAGKAVRLWDVASGKELLPTDGHVERVNCLAYSPDGSILASGGSENVIHLWDALSGKHLRRLEQEFTVGRLVFSPDGRQLVSTGGLWDHHVGVWEVQTGKRICVFEKPFNDMRGLVFSRDGKLLYVAHSKGTVSALAVATGKEQSHIKPPTDMPDWVELRVGQKVLAAAYERNNSIHLWDATTGKGLHRIEPDEEGGGGWPPYFSPDGKLLACLRVCKRQLVVWDCTSGRERYRWELKAAAGNPLRFSPDGRLIAAILWPADVGVFDLATGTPLMRFGGHRGEVADIAFSPDGRSLASAGADCSVLIWDLTGLRSPSRRLTVPPLESELQGLWSELGGTDAVKVHSAGWNLAALDAYSVPFLKRHLRPVPSVSEAEFKRLLRELDDDSFDVRQKANETLRRLAPTIRDQMRKAVETASAEVAKALQEALAESAEEEEKPPEALRRSLRAVGVLENLGTPEARRLLRALSGGARGATLTAAAADSLRRLAEREPTK